MFLPSPVSFSLKLLYTTGLMCLSKSTWVFSLNYSLKCSLKYSLKCSWRCSLEYFMMCSSKGSSKCSLKCSLNGNTLEVLFEVYSKFSLMCSWSFKICSSKESHKFLGDRQTDIWVIRAASQLKRKKTKKKGKKKKKKNCIISLNVCTNISTLVDGYNLSEAYYVERKK